MVFGIFKDDSGPKFVENYVSMLEESMKIGEVFQKPEVGEISNILMCGMGGSGACGDLLVDVAKLKVPIIVVKDYNIPRFANESTLVFCVSYSGNTEETLNQMMQAKSIGCKIVCVTSGGKMAEWAEKLSVPVIAIPGGRNPRDALPYMLFPVLSAIEKLGLGEYSKDYDGVKEMVKGFDLSELDRLADRIKNSRLAIYGTSDHIGSLRRMKNEFNENAKMAVIYDYFPEINHNEMNGYQRTTLTKNVDVILMRDRFETEEMKVRIETTKGILEHYVNSINEMWAVGDSKLARSVSFAFAASYLTGRIATLVGINRDKVPFVDRLKETLKTKLNTTEKIEKKILATN